MKKQYRYTDGTFGKKILYIYHDGKRVDTKKLYIDEFLDEKDRLDAEGYSYGYFEDEIEEAKRRYEYMLKNMIELK